MRLITSGYGEIIATIVLASFVPIFSFTLQTGELHRLLPMSTIPLAALLFAAFIAYEFPDYASDLKRDRQTLMVRLGWDSHPVRDHQLRNRLRDRLASPCGAWCIDLFPSGYRADLAIE